MERNKKRSEIHMGINADGTYVTLPPYVEVEEGVEVHPDHVEEYKKKREQLNKGAV